MLDSRWWEKNVEVKLFSTNNSPILEFTTFKLALKGNKKMINRLGNKTKFTNVSFLKLKTRLER